MDDKIIERLQKLRKEHGYSQEQLADELGVTRQAVSKWERGEASPDTENLIALAKLYNISVDDVLFEKPQAEEKAENKDGGDIGYTDIKDGHIDFMDIKRRLENGEEVVIKGEKHTQDNRSHMNAAEGLVAGITVMVCCIAYFLMGGIWGLWHPAWIIFFAIPVIPTIAGAIQKKDAKVFCYPVLVTAIYLLLGCQWKLWHPWWVIFLTIPIYYIVIDFFRKK